MSANLTRARLLLAQSRPADAEREAMLALAAEPQNPEALALLAFSLSAQGKGADALAAAEQALGLAADDPYLHYVRAHMLHRVDRHDAARSAANESLRLDPTNEETFALLAAIELSRSDSLAALTAAERALALNPEHVGAANLRSMALVRLGRKAEATVAVDFALHRDPENALSHANQGWNYLHQNDPRRAQEFFREALRLDPAMEYARDGMLQALRARNPIYRAMLAYFLWMGRQSTKFQWAFVIGVYFFSRFLNQQLDRSGGSPWLVGVAILFYAFVYLSWTAQPMFNLLLNLDRFGRHVLTVDERRASWWFGATFALALTALGWWIFQRTELPLLTALVLAATSICIAATFGATGRNRKILAASTGALAFIGSSALYSIWANPAEPGSPLLSLFFMGFFGFQILANVLRR